MIRLAQQEEGRPRLGHSARVTSRFSPASVGKSRRASMGESLLSLSWQPFGSVGFVVASLGQSPQTLVHSP